MEVKEVILTVINSGELAKGSLPKGRFDHHGGSIGSDEGSDWRLLNYADTIVATHSEIMLIRGQFCLIDRSGLTFVNSASQPLGKDIAIALKSGDNLKIGNYKIRVELPGDSFTISTDASIDDLFGTKINQLLDPSRPGFHRLESVKSENAQILQKAGNSLLDPMLAFDDLSPKGDIGELIPITDLGLSGRRQASSDQTSTTIESVSLSIPVPADNSEVSELRQPEKV